MIRSIERARPKIKQNTTRDMKPAPPSINLILRTWYIDCSSVAAGATSSSTTATSSTAGAASSTTASVVVSSATTGAAS